MAAREQDEYGYEPIDIDSYERTDSSLVYNPVSYEGLPEIELDPIEPPDDDEPEIVYENVEEYLKSLGSCQ